MVSAESVSCLVLPVEIHQDSLLYVLSRSEIFLYLDVFQVHLSGIVNQVLLKTVLVHKLRFVTSLRNKELEFPLCCHKSNVPTRWYRLVRHLSLKDNVVAFQFCHFKRWLFFQNWILYRSFQILDYCHQFYDQSKLLQLAHSQIYRITLQTPLNLRAPLLFQP